jgi:NTP pyrophosphatase (non-canonical NTP hydrolase)
MQIHEFQEMMKRLYFHRDSERGIKGTYDWLVDELEELGEALEEKNK